jgi:tyrosinase
MPTATALPTTRTVALRHRRDARRMTAGQIGDFRKAIRLAQGLSDERGYQYWAGIHGLPLPMYCKHGSPLFLAWHRAYLYFFEKALQDLVPGVTLPWWDWTQSEIPAAYSRKRTPDRKANPLESSPIQASAQSAGWTRTERDPGAPGAPPLPTPNELNDLLKLGDFADFQNQLENIHGGVHVWVGGTMGEVPVAAYDPVFWAHHTMIDRVWRLWQLRHPHGGPAAGLLGRALPPFPMTVAQTLDSESLGYDYAAATSRAPGPGH